MRRLRKITNIALMGFVIAANANALPSITDKLYLKAGIGVMKYGKFKETKDGYEKGKIKNSPVYNIGIGYRFTDAIRTDLNFQYGNFTYKSQDLKQKVKTIAAFVNGYYDFNFHKSFVPYLTAGIGLGKNKAGNLVDSSEKINGEYPTAKGKNTTNFIWNVGMGMQYKFNTHFALDLGYRYMNLGSTKTQDQHEDFRGGKQKIKGHQVLGALIYSF